MELRKKSYVKIDRVVEVGWEMLGAYKVDDEAREREFVLSEESWECLGDAVRMFQEAGEGLW